MLALSGSLLQKIITLRRAWLKLRCTVSLSISGPPSLGEEGIQHRYVQVAVGCESVELNDVWSWRVRFHIVLVDSVTSSDCKTYTFNVRLNRSTEVLETVAVW